ncbi:hypothetical protein DFQ29_000761 [Apophysomyces sp. BC1021]|nr:hypothetical protein DFQ29_000761 [Apophysomyces sp. BC1021]
MSLPPAFYDAFEPYFNSTSSPTLETFIEEYGQTIATYHKRGEDLSAVWTSRYSKSWNYFYRNTPEKQPPKIRSKDINWGDVALLILKMENTGNEDAGVSAAVSNVAKSDNSSHSTTTTPTLTTEFLDEFRATHACMDITKKWVLKSGTVVEDKMFSYGLKCKYENAAHSFILDLGDAVWSEVFNEEELEELRTYKVKKLPEVNGELLDYLNSYTNITNLDDLISHARSQTFNFDKQFDLDWVQDTIYTALRLFKAKYIPLSDQTEADIIRRVWYFVDTAYDDLPIDVRSGEMESTASSARRNMKRAYPSRKMHGHQADFLLKLSTSELACAEVGKKDGGATGSKELREAGLKCPKMMKDMMGNLIATYPHANDLVTVGYIIMGLNIRALVMDNPSSHVCRIQGTLPLHFPTTLDTFAIQVGEILCLIMQTKELIKKTMNTINSSRKISNITYNYLTACLPPCAMSPKPSPKRLKTNNSASAQ